MEHLRHMRHEHRSWRPAERSRRHSRLYRGNDRMEERNERLQREFRKEPVESLAWRTGGISPLDLYPDTLTAFRAIRYLARNIKKIFTTAQKDMSVLPGCL